MMMMMMMMMMMPVSVVRHECWITV